MFIFIDLLVQIIYKNMSYNTMEFLTLTKRNG